MKITAGICHARGGVRYFEVNRFSVILLTASIAIAAASSAFAESWESTLSPATPGAFPPLRPLHATYSFGWSGFTAATGDVRFSRAGNRTTLEGKVRTIDFVHGLWNFEAEHAASADATTLRPIEVKQIESARSKRVTTTATFIGQGVTATRTDSSRGVGKTRRLDMPNLFDFQTALLQIRSQQLANGETQRVVVFPGKDPYLATITVEGRDKIKVPASSFNAIKLDLKLSKIGRNKELKPHKKFRKATIWLSDDGDRMLLRAEAEVFIGSVFAELQSIEYDRPQMTRD